MLKGKNQKSTEKKMFDFNREEKKDKLKRKIGKKKKRRKKMKYHWERKERSGNKKMQE